MYSGLLCVSVCTWCLFINVFRLKIIQQELRIREMLVYACASIFVEQQSKGVVVFSRSSMEAWTAKCTTNTRETFRLQPWSRALGNWPPLAFVEQTPWARSTPDGCSTCHRRQELYDARVTGEGSQSTAPRTAESETLWPWQSGEGLSRWKKQQVELACCLRTAMASRGRRRRNTMSLNSVGRSGTTQRNSSIIWAENGEKLHQTIRNMHTEAIGDQINSPTIPVQTEWRSTGNIWQTVASLTARFSGIANSSRSTTAEINQWPNIE